MQGTRGRVDAGDDLPVMNAGPKWSLRNGSPYRRLCARAGCGAPASVTLRFQPTERQAWLVELDEHAARTQGDLCNRHAAALVLPRGWELHDERDLRAAPSVVSGTVDPTPPSTNANTGRARRARVRRQGATAEQAAGTGAPRRLEGVVPASPDDQGTAADAGGSGRAVGAFGSSDDGDVEEALGVILDARTPLLRRAFRNAKPL
jgi:hypothetical protein